MFDSRCKRAQVLGAVVLRKDKRTQRQHRMAKGEWGLSRLGAR